MQLQPDDMIAVVKRPEPRANLGGIIKMIEDGRECQDIVTQMAAVSKAIDRAGFATIAVGLRQCLTDPGTQPDGRRLDGEALPLLA